MHISTSSDIDSYSVSSLHVELDRDDEMMKCWDASGKLPLKALRLFPQRKNKQIHEMNDVKFRKSAAATQQQKNTTTQFSEFTRESLL